MHWYTEALGHKTEMKWKIGDHIHTPTSTYSFPRTLSHILCYQFQFSFFNICCIETLNSTDTHVIVCQSVEAFPPALFLGSQVQVWQNLPCWTGAPLCGESQSKKWNISA